MRLIKFIFFSLLGVATAVLLGIFIFWKLPNIYQNRITTYVVNKALRYANIDGYVGFAELDLINKQALLGDINFNFEGTVFHLDHADFKYRLVNNVRILGFYAENPKLNNVLINTALQLEYSEGLVFRMIGAQEKGQCNINFAGDVIDITSCNFVFADSIINLAGSFERKHGGFRAINLNADFTKIDLLNYKYFKPFLKHAEAFNILDELVHGGYASGNFRVGSDKANKQILDENNMSGEVELSDVKFKYDPDFPIVENVKAKAFLQGNKLKCDILGGNAHELQVQNGVVNFEWSGFENSIIDIDLNVSAPSSNINYFINDKQRLSLKDKGIDFSATKGLLGANVKVLIPTAENLHATVKIAGQINNFVLGAFQKRVVLDKSDVKFVIDNNSLVVEGSGYVNKYPSTIKYEQDMPYTKANLVSMIKLENLKDDPAALIAFEGSEVMKIVYEDSVSGSKVTAFADLTKMGIRIPKFDFIKMKGEKCLIKVQSGNTIDDIKFQISGSKDLEIRGEFNVAKNILNLDSLNTNSMRNIKGRLQMLKDKTVCSITGEYINLENYDLFNLFKKKQANLGLDAKVNLNSIKMKNGINVDNLAFQVECDSEKCFEGRASAKINDKEMLASLSSHGSVEEWTIKSQDAGLFLKALGIYNNMKNGNLNLGITTRRNVVNIGEVPKVMHGKLLINDFVVTKTPFIARLFSLLSLSLENILKTITNSSEISFSKLEADFAFESDMINILDANMSGPSFDLMFKGSINFDERKVKLRGATFPSMYGINKVLKNTPVIGNLLYSGKRKGIIFAPFNVAEKY